jgi:hypothetical protein
VERDKAYFFSLTQSKAVLKRKRSKRDHQLKLSLIKLQNKNKIIELARRIYSLSLSLFFLLRCESKYEKNTELQQTETENFVDIKTKQHFSSPPRSLGNL